VDGAILLSPEGIIHSFGVILDGQASKNGNSARGARYNSAIRYIDEMSRKVNCLALIVSEDGYVDLYSTLTNRS
jgi:DNA integrity scanning protein DisA with diadenylate cyclase activity